MDSSLSLAVANYNINIYYETNFSVEEYIMKRTLQNTHLANRKSWLIFGKSVLPQSFPIHFQLYLLECEQKSVDEAALNFSDLLQRFNKEKTVIQELKRIIFALASKQESFLKKLFFQLPDGDKHHIMMKHTRDVSVEQYCDSMSTFLKVIPKASILTHGTAIIYTFLAREKFFVGEPINLCREVLVTDVLPLLLSIDLFECKPKLLFVLLRISIEFYSSLYLSSSASNIRGIRKTYDPDSEEAWVPLTKLLEAVSLRCNWNYPEISFKDFNAFSLQQLVSTLKHQHQKAASSEGSKEQCDRVEVYFSLVIAFFFYLHHYGRIVQPQLFSDHVTNSYKFVMMEGIRFPIDECSESQSHNFKKSETGYLAVGQHVPNDEACLLISSFLSAAECWDMLHENQHFTEEFDRLGETVHLMDWPVLKEFQVGFLLYKERYQEAIGKLVEQQSRASDATKDKIALQLSSCMYSLGNAVKAAELMMSVAFELNPTSLYSATPLLAKCPDRYVYFMGGNNHEILQYCISRLLLMLKSTKDVATFGDLALGYKLVLMQYDLPRENDYFTACIEEIMERKTFEFTNFFNYIIHVDILEEFSYLALPNGGDVDMRLLPLSPMSAKLRTRGASRNAQIDLRENFIKQMSRCYDNLDNLYITFLKEQHTLLLVLLMNVRASEDFQRLHAMESNKDNQQSLE